jgi:PBSX family phage terminase large subunit
MLSPAQQLVAKSLARFRTLISGRRFGKTTFSLRELFRFANKPNQEVWYVAPTYKQAKQVMWRKLKKKLYNLNWPKAYGNKLKINEAELYVDLPWGSRISLKGADNYDSLRGVGINFLIMDEVADIDPEAFYEVLAPTLADTGGSALFIGTPKGKGNWSYDLFMKPEDDSDWESFHFTTLEGGFVSEEEVEKQRKLLDDRTFRQEFEADFVTSGNRVWYSFDRDRNVKPYYTEDTETPKVLYTGWDFNIDPMSVVIFVRHGDEIHAIDEIRIFGSNTDEAVDELNNRYPKSKIYAYPDPASRQRKTSAGGRTDLKILQNAGYVVRAPHSHNAIRDGVNAVNSKLKNSLGEISFYVDPNCKNLIEGLEKHNYKPGTTIPDKSTGYDHMMDAMRYFIDYEFPVTRELKESINPKRFGHKIGQR